jgi:hypothetical protein
LHINVTYKLQSVNRPISQPHQLRNHPQPLMNAQQVGGFGDEEGGNA